MKRIIFTHHARERMMEFGLKGKQVLQLIDGAEIDKPVHMSKFKQRKYGERNRDIQYLRNGTYIFTIKKEPNVDILITLTDQRINLR